MKKMMKRKVEKKEKNMEERLKQYSQNSIEEIMKEYDTSIDGYNEVEALEKLEEVGKNIIHIKKDKSLLVRIKEAVINPFNLVLILVAIVTFITDVVLTKRPSYETFFLILFTVFASAIVSFTQQEKSNKAAKKLQTLIHNQVDVLRNGNNVVIDLEEVVPGEIIKLSSGDMIPGDVRFIQVKDLFIDQSSLTGESAPVEKTIEAGKETELTSLTNIGFMETNVVSGTALAIVLTTGDDTYFGSMAKAISQQKGKTNFEKDIDTVSRLLIKFMLVMVPIIFLINLFTKNDVVESLLFGITIAVGITPEMLPVIMTSTLAKGAIAMSKKKTIVKQISSIQSFGQMNILCTDKTGTLTEDEIILERYMDVEGNEDPRILKHAFLNSYFQTGLKNLIDIAIINRAEKEKENMKFLEPNYSLEDEIPFDFTRRRMSVVLKDKNGKRQLITKGAVDEMLETCSFIEQNGQVIPFTQELRNKAYTTYESYNKNGLRVLAIAQKNEIHNQEEFGVQDEKDMVLIGFVGFLDPPKESAKTAIAALKKHGVKVVVLTGDSEGVAVNVCEKVKIPTKYKLTGKDVDEMTEEELKKACQECCLFSKLTPFQKERIVKTYQDLGNTVGYMGDGINDSLPLKAADVGISVDSAVDIAKETADIILLEKDLNVLEEGVIEGRKTFINISKYIHMATSGNFGNMLSVMIASIFLPFLPLLPIHILIQNLLNDFAQLGMPFDNVDLEDIDKPKRWNTKSITKVMFSYGAISSVLDILCFVVLWYVFGFNTIQQEALFQTGWFVFGVISQTLIIHMIRTNKIPFIQSRASRKLMISTISVSIIAIVIGFTNISTIFDLSKLPYNYLIWLIALIVIYGIIIFIGKKLNILKNQIE